MRLNNFAYFFIFFCGVGKYLLQSESKVYYKVGQLFFITKWGKLCYKVGQLAIYKYFSYYKVGQVLLQSGAGITKWGIITKWCMTVSRPLPMGVNKKVISLMKDEMGGNIIKEFVTLNPKVYAYKYIREGVIKEDKKCEGVKRSVVLNNLSLNDYMHTLNTDEIKIVKQNLIRSKNHNVKTIVEEKRAFSTKNDKRIMINNIKSVAIGSIYE